MALVYSDFETLAVDIITRSPELSAKRNICNFGEAAGPTSSLGPNE